MGVGNSCTIEKICSKIYLECNCLVTWNWDDRFQAVLSEFPAEKEIEVLPVLEKYFDKCWDEETIAEAPGKIRSVAKGLGELRQGQRLFSCEPDMGELLLGAYWPWQNGQRVSLRILADVVEIDMDMEAPPPQSMETPLYS